MNRFLVASAVFGAFQGAAVGAVSGLILGGIVGFVLTFGREPMASLVWGVLLSVVGSGVGAITGSIIAYRREIRAEREQRQRDNTA